MSLTDEPGAEQQGPVRYLAFLEQWMAESPPPPPSPRGGEPRPAADVPPPIPADETVTGIEIHSGTAGPAGALRIPRRREAKVPLRVRLAPEQLFWLRLAAARAGSKVDESMLVAAGLALLEQRAIDWRLIRSRRDLCAALEPPAPTGGGAAVTSPPETP